MNNPEKKCEHDKGEYFEHITKKVGKIECPFCKPAPVEPSVESIARSIRKNFAVGQRLDSFALACLEDQILTALRNERNRK